MKKILSLLVLLPFVTACSAENSYYYREPAPEIIVRNPDPYYSQPRVNRYHGHDEARRIDVVPSRQHHGHQSVEANRHGHQ